MKTLYVNKHVSDGNAIEIEWVNKPLPRLNENEYLIKVASSGVNPSDALAMMGYFKHAVLPRIPGRDFAGIVIEGPSPLVGKHVWGTGGAAGISFDGTQAEFIKLPIHAISEVPNNLDLVLAGAQPLPYVTAYYGLEKRAHIQAQETVLVVGALGQVGSAAMSICHWKNCNSIALVRGKDELEKAKKLGWNALNSEEDHLSEKIKIANGGRPVQVILNSVGNVYWNDFMNSLSEFGRIITIGAKENFRDVHINLFDLYRSNQEIIGVNTVSFDFSKNAELLDELKVGFEENKLIPLAIDQTSTYTPDHAKQAYQTVIQGSSGKRVVIKFT